MEGFAKELFGVYAFKQDGFIQTRLTAIGYEMFKEF